MASERVEWVLRQVETWNSGDLDAFMQSFPPDFEFEERGRAVLIESRWHLAAPQTGGEIPVSDFNVVLWFDRDDDQPTRMAAFFDRERALEAANEGAG